VNPFLKHALRTAAIGFPIMVLIQTGSQIAGFGTEKEWVEIVALSAVWAVLYSLAVHGTEALKT
jgi:hypothetical protein